MAKTKKMSGSRKLAILFLVLGSSLSSKVLKHFNEQEIERISMEIANTSRVEKDELEEVLHEFMVLNEARQFIIDGGVDHARDLLEQTLGPQKATDIMRKLKDTSKVKPFTFIRNADTKQLVNLISQEHPQTIALILSYLEPDQAALILPELSDETQADIARRIAVMERTSPEMIKSVEKVLKERLSTVFQDDFTAAGGISTIVDILNRVDRGTEKLILEDLERDDEELAEEIRQRMFIFEDVITLDDASIQRVIRELDSKDLSVALKGASEEVKTRIMKNVSRRAGEILQEDMDFMGPIRLREVEEAQQKIVAVIRRLDETGEIIISRGGEDAIVV